MISKSFSDSFAVSAAVGSSITINSASRASARRISTFCWSASGSIPAGTSAGSAKPARSFNSPKAALSRRRSTTLSLCGSRAEEYVLGDALLRDEHDLLGDHRDAVRQGVAAASGSSPAAR